ncbi:ribosome maturation factor RimM [Microvirga alba]|uniref:Ribosome maturation factor RimM n=1 Tax=Microvirga alba TaxID=2791025 RepID=A0A931FQ21_9HYPH|nr:ribosome maturation factor RimM [Microvirga alba]MBF9233033.1 ribosome maturation factor RimM [Microvirga alba]
MKGRGQYKNLSHGERSTRESAAGEGRAPSGQPSPLTRTSGPASPVGRGEATREDLVLVGEFGRAHGLKGEVRLKSYTADPAAIADYNPLTAADGRSLSLKNARQAPGGAADMLVVRVEGVSSREGAEALNRVQLYLERAKLPEPDEEDEFLLADLIGLPVQNETGTVLGTIIDVPNYGGGDLLEIAPALTGPTAFLPFTKAFVPVVEIAQKRIVIAPPEDFFAPAKAAPEDES